MWRSPRIYLWRGHANNVGLLPQATPVTQSGNRMAARSGGVLVRPLLDTLCGSQLRGRSFLLLRGPPRGATSSRLPCTLVATVPVHAGRVLPVVRPAVRRERCAIRSGAEAPPVRSTRMISDGLPRTAVAQESRP
jgi:hypothetical protein